MSSTTSHLPCLSLATLTLFMLDQARPAPSLLQANTFTLLLRSGLKPEWMLKSGGACRHRPLLPLTTRLGPLSLILYWSENNNRHIGPQPTLHREMVHFYFYKEYLRMNNHFTEASDLPNVSNLEMPLLDPKFYR